MLDALLILLAMLTEPPSEPPPGQIWPPNP